MGGERHAGEVGEGRHQRGGAGFDGGAEGGKIDLGEGAVRDVDGGIVAARRAGAVGGEMLRRGGEAGEALALEAAHLGLGEAGGDEGVLARSLGDPAPARVAGDVEHRREGEVDAGGGGLRGGAAGGRLPERGVEGAGLGEGDREHGAEAVQDVEPEEEREPEPGLLDGEALVPAHRLPAPEVEEAADPAGADERLDVLDPGGAGDGVAGADHGELADLLGQGHAGEEGLGLGAGGARGEGQRGGGGDQGEDAAAVGHGEELGMRAGRASPPDPELGAPAPPISRLRLDPRLFY